jgi:hypothetical protein
LTIFIPPATAKAKAGKHSLILNSSPTMSNTIRNIGLIALAAAILYKPAKRLLMAQRADRDDDFYGEDEGVLRRKAFANAYRGEHKPHHRHAKSNGHTHIHADE